MGESRWDSLVGRRGLGRVGRGLEEGWWRGEGGRDVNTKTCHVSVFSPSLIPLIRFYSCQRQFMLTDKRSQASTLCKANC